MLTVESHRGRTIVGRLDRGEDLIEGLRAVCAARQIRGGVVTAIGALESAEVTHYLPGTRAYGPSRTLYGPLEILSLHGNLSESDGELSIHLHVTLSREGDNGVEVLGGHLQSARVFSCELCIVALDDVLLRRAPDPGTGLRLWQTGFEQGSDGTGRVVEPVMTEAAAEAGQYDPSEVTSGREATSPEAGIPGEHLDWSTGRTRASARSQDSLPDGAPQPQAESGASRGQVRSGEAEEDQNTPTPTRRAPRPAAIAWEDVAVASAAAQREPTELPVRPDRKARAAEDPDDDDGEDEEEPPDYVDLEPGDVIDHPKFGRCRVERVEGEEEYVHVRLRNRNLVRLSLDVITLELTGSEGGHQVFRARIG